MIFSIPSMILTMIDICPKCKTIAKLLPYTLAYPPKLLNLCFACHVDHLNADLSNLINDLYQVIHKSPFIQGRFPVNQNDKED